MLGDTRDVDALCENVVHVALLWRAWIELALDAVEPRAQKSSLREVGITCGVDGSVLEPASARDPDETGRVLPTVVLVDRRPEAEVPEALVRVHGGGGDR